MKPQSRVSVATEEHRGGSMYPSSFEIEVRIHEHYNVKWNCIICGDIIYVFVQCLERVFVKDQLLFEGTKTGALVYDGCLSTHTNGTGPMIILSL